MFLFKPSLINTFDLIISSSEELREKLDVTRMFVLEYKDNIGSQLA